MKKNLIIVSAALAMCAALSAAGCADTGKSEPNAYRVTFVQKGYANVVKVVEAGGTLADVPEPNEKTGYTVTWDRTDFTYINGNITVTAIETANEYKIYYSLGDRASDGEAKIADSEQTVTFDASYSLFIPECEGYKFVKWEITGSETEFKGGIWSVAGDVYLTAVWKMDKDSDRGWSDIY